VYYCDENLHIKDLITIDLKIENTDLQDQKEKVFDEVVIVLKNDKLVAFQMEIEVNLEKKNLLNQIKGAVSSDEKIIEIDQLNLNEESLAIKDHHKNDQVNI
jgi:CHAD domain-containing protein